MKIVIGKLYKGKTNGAIVKALSLPTLRDIQDFEIEGKTGKKLIFNCEIIENKNPEYVGKIIGAFVDQFEPYEDSNEEIYKRAIDKWGERSQLEMLQEESTELALATRKFIRVPSVKTFEELCGELADVEIMTDQFKFMNPNAINKIADIKKQKLERLSKRLDNNSFE